MAITYHSGRRIQGLDAEGFSSGTMSATGGTVSTNTSVTPNRKIHTFTTVGNTNFVVTGNATDVQYLVIGGGGGGTANAGGGAGAYRESGVSTGDSAITLTTGTYTITVGAGGSGNDSGSPSGNNDGSSSIFSTITSEGGGSGGQQNGGAGGACTIGGSNNGSGGGGGGENSGGACAGGASGAYGNAGGSGNATYPAGAGGGGGGAGSAGTNATNSLAGGNGGNGLTSSITGSPVPRAGGGGGGTWQTSGEGSGGSGGGGEGLNRSGGGGTTHATANTGSGGGGKWDTGSAGNGGSGIVIISYVPDQSYSVNNLTNVQLGSRYEATDTRKMYNYNEPSQDFASVLSTYAPQFFLKLDEGTGTTLTNSGSNSGYTASVTVNSSNPVWDAGVDGANKALKFNGNNNGLGYIGHTNLPTESTGDNFTMGLTFKISTDFTGGDSNHHHLWKWNNGGLGFWQMNMTNDGYIGTAYFNGGWQHLVGTTDSSDNAWHTFFLTCTSGSAVKGYLDGTQEFSGTANRSGYAGNDADWISHNGGNGVISYDNAFFKNTVMTASEISSLHTLLVPSTTNEWQEIGT